ncbi:MAG TPA: hypothetical protein PLC06_15515, partial [Promineifilum sp.]|nr:hypothetical protein [Promineifilum sp.]
MNNKLLGLLMIPGLLVFGLAAARGDAIGEPRLGEPPQAPARALVEEPREAETGSAAYTLFLPSIQAPPPWVNTASRAESQQFFRTGYLGT